MDKQAFDAMVRGYAADLMKTAERGALLHSAPEPEPEPEPDTPVPPPPRIAVPEPAAPGDAEINPPESGPGQEPLQSIPMEPETYEDFLLKNPKYGELRLQAVTAGGAAPVAGAEITVSRGFTDGPREFAAAVTDMNGIADGIRLPAPDKSLSRKPLGEAPYAAYTVTAAHPAYRTEVYVEVPVFEGIKSIQPVRFVPARPDYQ